MSVLYRLVYASKNLLAGSEAEMAAQVEQILATSRRNNARAGVTGALMFNNGAFAQVLEGPQRGVEETFERIQRDTRHGEVTVLECRPVAGRGFDAWSMAFVGQSARGRALWSGLAAESGFELGRLSGDAVFSALHNLVLEDEGRPSEPVPTASAPVASPPVEPAPVDEAPVASPPPARADVASPSSANAPSLGSAPLSASVPRLLDAAQVRDEIVRQGPVGAAAVEREAAQPDYGRIAALPVLKAALADERARTTALRGEVDELRVALANSRAEHDALLAQRDLWRQRMRVLAAMLGDDPAEIRRIAAALDRPDHAEEAERAVA